MALRTDYHNNRHHLRHHVIPERNEGLDIGLAGNRFATGRFKALIADTLDVLSATISAIVSISIGTLTVTTSAILSYLTGPGYLKIDSSEVISVQAAPIPIADGGTGGVTAAAARTALGSTVVGDAVFIAASAAAARSAIDSPSNAEVQPVFTMAPESAGFPTTNFPQLKKAVGTNWVTYSLGFDQTTDEAAYWKFKIPTTAVFTAATLKVVSRQLAATTGGVAWQCTTITRADGEAYDTAGTVDDVAVAPVKGTAGMLLFQTKALTITGWVAGEMLYVKLNRDVSADDVAEDSELVTATIELS